MKFRKKPVEVEAYQFNGEDNYKDLLKWMNRLAPTAEPWIYDGQIRGLLINTLEGTMTANVGDYIIQGVNGEFYPCKPDIFNKTYEAAE